MDSPTERHSAPIRSHRDLIVWQRAKALVGKCYRLCRLLPLEEKYDMVRQLRTAAASVANNIAEGHGRLSTADYARHVSIARGSLKEVESLLEIGVEVGYLDNSQIDESMQCADEIGRMLWSLARRLGCQQLPSTLGGRAPED